MNNKSNSGNGKTGTQKRSADQHSGSMLKSFFDDGLKDLYWAEKHLVKTLPKMKKAAASHELQNAFDGHLEATKQHVERLEQIFEMLGEKPQAKKCEAIEGITKEGERIINETEDGTATRDVGLIMAGQKTEHYEIATYGGLAQLARTLNLDDISGLLELTLSEEKEADELLTSVAESHINYEAAMEVE